MAEQDTLKCLGKAILLVGALGLLAGCAGGPSRTASAVSASSRAEGDDPHEGWLFKRMTGRGAAAPRQEAPVAAATPNLGQPAAAPPMGPSVYQGAAAGISPVAPGAYPGIAPGSTMAAYPQPGMTPPQNPGYYPPPANYSAAGSPAAYPPSAPGMYPPPAASEAYPPVVAPGGYPSLPPAPRDYLPAPASYPPSAPSAYSPRGSAVVPAAAYEPVYGDASVPPGAPTPMLPPMVAPPQTPGPGTPGTPTIVSTPDAKPKDDDDAGFDWAKLAPENVWKDVKTAFGYGPDEKIARANFQEGEALFKQRKFADAAPKFYTASWRWPDSAMEEDSMFLLGESYFFADEYGKAHDAYANLLKKHDNTRYLDTVMSRAFAIGQFWEKKDREQPHWPTTPNVSDKTRPWFDTFGNALAAYEMVRMHDPTGPLADQAIMAMATAHFRKEHWEEAAHNFDLIRTKYPKSKFQYEAHMLGLQSWLRIYQGAAYDGKPLKEAREIGDQILTQFRTRLPAGEETRVREALARIFEQRAEREWFVGQYWDKKGYYGAARQYYKTLVSQYPRTGFAEAAQKRLEQIHAEPDEPPKRLRWLTQLLSREEVR